MSRQDLKTKGRVITRMARFTDLAENLIFLGRLQKLWTRLIDKAELAPGERVVDLGCGTGDVAIMAAEMVLPDGEVSGVDASAEMIALASQKAVNSRARIDFHLAPMEELPFADCRFDVVLCCQALHHVPREAKFQALSEMHRVLKPGGRLILLDHGPPYLWYLKILFFPFRWDIIEYQADNFRGEIPFIVADSFGNVEEIDRFFGWMRVWKAVKDIN